MSDSKRDFRFYPFCEAVFNDRAAAEILLAEDPTLLEARNGCGETALHYLAIENQLEGAKWLWERGADLNTRDDFESTPLIAAAGLGHLEMCRYLLAHGADIFALDHLGRSAISAANSARPIPRDLLQLLLARRGDADINLFFDDLEADSALKSQGPRMAEFWSALGLQPRFNFEDSDGSDEEN